MKTIVNLHRSLQILGTLGLCLIMTACQNPTPAQQQAITDAEVIAITAGVSKATGATNKQIEDAAIKQAEADLIPAP